MRLLTLYYTILNVNNIEYLRSQEQFQTLVYSIGLMIVMVIVGYVVFLAAKYLQQRGILPRSKLMSK